MEVTYSLEYTDDLNVHVVVIKATDLIGREVLSFLSSFSWIEDIDPYAFFHISPTRRNQAFKKAGIRSPYSYLTPSSILPELWMIEWDSLPVSSTGDSLARDSAYLCGSPWGGNSIFFHMEKEGLSLDMCLNWHSSFRDVLIQWKELWYKQREKNSLPQLSSEDYRVQLFREVTPNLVRKHGADDPFIIDWVTRYFEPPGWLPKADFKLSKVGASVDLSILEAVALHSRSED